jgi:DNA-binding transcriptional ArsR family regulator
LEEEKELCPCELSDILGMGIPAISQHLRKLKTGNIVETRKEGQTIYYSLTQENIKILGPLFKHLNQQTQKKWKQYNKRVLFWVKKIILKDQLMPFWLCILQLF